MSQELFGVNYSIRYKDAKGITSRSEFLPFATDGEAKTYASDELPSSAMIEIWKGDDLLVRIQRPDPKRSPH